MSNHFKNIQVMKHWDSFSLAKKFIQAHVISKNNHLVLIRSNTNSVGIAPDLANVLWSLAKQINYLLLTSSYKY